MGLFRPDRRPRGPDPWLRAKMLAFALGAALALVATALESTPLLLGAIAVLSAGALLRFLPRRPS